MKVFQPLSVEILFASGEMSLMLGRSPRRTSSLSSSSRIAGHAASKSLDQGKSALS
jgi:hypothetical protein